jgi:hypothetical protein
MKFKERVVVGAQCGRMIGGDNSIQHAAYGRAVEHARMNGAGTQDEDSAAMTGNLRTSASDKSTLYRE